MNPSGTHKARTHARPSILMITRVLTGKYRIGLERSDDESRMKPMQTACDVAVQPAALEHFVDRIGRLIAEANAIGDPPDGRALSEAGKGLLDTLLPRGDAGAMAVRADLASLTPGSPVLVSTDDPSVPWELMKEEGGDDYLGLKFDVGRRLVSGASFPSGRRVSARRPSALIVSNPTGDLPQSEVETRTVREFLERRGVQCSFLAGPEATFPALLEQIRQEHQLIHFAGHVRYDDASREYALVLREGRPFTASAVRSHLRGRPFVFLNGCESGLVVKGLTEGFLAGGARAVIGTLCRIPDGGAQEFAHVFYDAFLSGRFGIGGAVRRARSEVKGKPGLGATWASFVLYGDPTMGVRFSVNTVAPVQQGPARANPQTKLADGPGASLAVGSLRESDCTAEAWQQLQQAVKFAAQPSGTVVTSFHLFQGFLADSKGPVASSLRRLGVSIEQMRPPQDEATLVLDAGAVRCTENSGKILLMAQASASADVRKVNPDDLLNAFVGHGGGQTGARLRKLGILPACLTSQLFRDGGFLDYARFDPAGAAVLEIAEEFADQTHHDTVHRFHVLYGLLRVPESSLGSAIRGQGCDPEILAELWYAELPRGNATTPHDRPLRITSLSTYLLEVICNAELLAAGQQGCELIGAAHLARSWQASGGGLGGSFLVRNGLKVTQLFG